ncbi:MAG: LruC domain-containing protein [Balneolales bacterium]|nr:LruC domain-containing protein [Balneolales bacterium]
MIRLIQFALLSILLASLVACDSKTSSNIDDDSLSFSDLIVSEKFTWSNATSIDLNITFPDESLTGSFLEVRYMDGSLASRLFITEKGVKFTQPLPDHIEELILYQPDHGLEQVINAQSSDIVFEGVSARGFSNKDMSGILNDDEQLQSYSILYRYHMFEDLWPGLGDYDFNDVVIRTQEVFARDMDNLIREVNIWIYFLSQGGVKDLGLGVQVFAGSDAVRTYLPTNSINFLQLPSPAGYVDPDASNTAIISPNLRNNRPEWNTFGPTYNDIYSTFYLRFLWDHTLPSNQMPHMHYFLFKSNDRSFEIHTVGNPPTEAANTSLFGSNDDNSSTAAWDRTPGRSFTLPAPFYRTENFLPWGISLLVTPTIEPQIVREKIEISDAYPFFKGWAQSEGTTQQSWWLFPLESKVLTAP